MDAGMTAGLAGGVIGLMGGIIGTYFGLVNTTRPRERALMVRIAALGWLWMAVLVALAFTLAAPWKPLAMLANLPVLMLIPAGNRLLARARAEDQQD